MPGHPLNPESKESITMKQPFHDLVRQASAVCATACKGLPLLLLLPALAACGQQNEAEPSAEELDAAVEQTQAHVRAALKASGVVQEGEDGSLSTTYEKGGESVQMGDRLPAPGWLPAGFPLPADLNISIASVDKSGEKNLGGRTAATRDEVYRAVESWAAGAGWEMIPANDRVITLANARGEVIDAVLEGGQSFSLRLSTRSVEDDRQKAAVERSGSGRAEIRVADRELSLDGSCRIKGNYYLFEYSSADGMTYAQLEIQDTGEQPRGSANVHVMGGGRFPQYTVSFPLYGGEEPSVRAGGDAFSVRGQFASMTSEGMQPFPGSFAVRCSF